MPNSLYTRLANVVTIEDLRSPLQAPVRGDMSLTSAIAAINAFGTVDGTHVSLVFDDGKPSGWTQRNLLEDDAYDLDKVLVREARCEFDIRSFITANSTAWKALQVFAQGRHDFLFILDGTDIIGTLFYRDLFKPVFRTCLFALTFEVEQKILQLCLQDPKASWLALDEDRRRFLENKYRERTNRRARSVMHAAAKMGGKVGDELRRTTLAFDDSPTEMLEHCYFNDRIEIVKRRGLFRSINAPGLLNDLDRARKLRNWSVHPESTDEMMIDMENPSAFWKLIQDCHRLLVEMDKFMPPDNDDPI